MSASSRAVSRRGGASATPVATPSTSKPAGYEVFNAATPVGLVATPSSESVIVHASAVAEQHLLVADLARGQYADVSALIKSNKDQQAALKRDAETLVGMRGTSGQIMNMTKADSDYDLLYQLKMLTPVDCQGRLTNEFIASMPMYEGGYKRWLDISEQMKMNNTLVEGSHFTKPLMPSQPKKTVPKAATKLYESLGLLVAQAQDGNLTFGEGFGDLLVDTIVNIWEASPFDKRTTSASDKQVYADCIAENMDGLIKQCEAKYTQPLPLSLGDDTEVDVDLKEFLQAVDSVTETAGTSSIVVQKMLTAVLEHAHKNKKKPMGTTVMGFIEHYLTCSTTRQGKQTIENIIDFFYNSEIVTKQLVDVEQEDDPDVDKGEETPRRSSRARKQVQVQGQEEEEEVLEDEDDEEEEEVLGEEVLEEEGGEPKKKRTASDVESSDDDQGSDGGEAEAHQEENAPNEIAPEDDGEWMIDKDKFILHLLDRVKKLTKELNTRVSQHETMARHLKVKVTDYTAGNKRIGKVAKKLLPAELQPKKKKRKKGD